jgi:hypothetical protein
MADDPDRPIPQRRARRPAQPDLTEQPSPDSWDAARPENVERARRLLNDPDYPPPAVVKAVAKTLSRKLRTGQPGR